MREDGMQPELNFRVDCLSILLHCVSSLEDLLPFLIHCLASVSAAFPGP